MNKLYLFLILVVFLFQRTVMTTVFINVKNEKRKKVTFQTLKNTNEKKNNVCNKKTKVESLF